MKNKYITFGAPAIEDDEINEVVDSMRSGWLGTGPKVKKFEDLIKKETDAKYVVALNSCTAALHLSLLACDICPGDEIITTPLTFCATINTIIHAGATPILVDINPETMNIDEKKIEEKITNKTKAIIPVHMYGRSCEMDIITDIAKRNNLYVIEDAAHAIGATYKKNKIGNIGDLTCFSFYVTKNITTVEGGAVATNNKKLADIIKIYGLHGMSKDAWSRYSDNGYKHYQVVVPGYKYNMTDIQASIGIHQIKRVKEYDKKREEIWNYYNKKLKNLPITLPPKIPKHIHHAKHLYTILIDKHKTGIGRDEFMEKLHEHKIGSGVHFIPIHLHKYYKEKFKYNTGDYPEAENIGEKTMSLPLSAKISLEDAERVVDTIKNILNDCKK